MSVEAIAENLRRIRQARGKTQKEVATQAGMSVSGYRKLETGVSRPNAGTLETLSKGLGVTVMDLLQVVPRLRQCRFRQLKKLKSREQILATVGRWYKDYCDLEEMLGERAKFKLAGLADELEGKGEERAIDAAGRVRARLHLKDEAVEDPCGFLEAMNIKLLKLPYQSEGFFGLSINEEGGPAIVVNVWDRISVERWIHSAFHELGHLLLHLEDYRNGGQATEEDKQEEQEANVFASHLLMPEDLFRRRWDQTSGLALVHRVLKVKRIFKVSYRAVLFRVQSRYAGENVWAKFKWQYRQLTGKRLTGHTEPEPRLKPDEFSVKQVFEDLYPEPQPLCQFDFWTSRLLRLVKKAVLTEKINLNRGAEILGVDLEALKAISATWSLGGEEPDR